MTRHGTSPHRRPARGLALLTLLALAAAACGGSTASAPPASVGPTAAGSVAPSAPASAAATDAGYTGPEAEITYSIWGDPSEIKNQQAIVDAFHAVNPKITVKVDVSDWDTYWDKLQTGIVGGNAPDVFAMDGPLFPDYQTRDVLLDLKPYIDRDGYDLTQLADLAVADFTTPEGQFGLPRDLNVIALFYNKKLFDAAGVAYPDESWDWAKLVEVGKQLTVKDASGQGQPVGLLHRELGHGELLVVAGLAERRGHHLGRPQDEPRRQRPGHRRHPVPAGPDVEGPHHAGPGHLADRQRRRLRAGQGGHGGQRLLAGRDAPQRRASTSGSRRCPKGPAGQATSINPTGAVVFKGSKSPDAAWEFVKYLASPAAQTKIMELKASLPANKEVLAGPFATSFPGADVLAAAIAYAHLKPSFKGYNDWTTALQTEIDANVFLDPKKTAKQAITDVMPQLDEILAKQ